MKSLIQLLDAEGSYDMFGSDAEGLAAVAMDIPAQGKQVLFWLGCGTVHVTPSPRYDVTCNERVLNISQQGDSDTSAYPAEIQAVALRCRGFVPFTPYEFSYRTPTEALLAGEVTLRNHRAVPASLYVCDAKIAQLAKEQILSGNFPQESLGWR